MSDATHDPSDASGPASGTETSPNGLAHDRDDLPRAQALRWLAVLLAIAAVLRGVGLTYQLPVSTGPDAMGLIGAALRMGTGDLNPHWFTWPAAPFYFLAACYGVMFVICRALGVVEGAEAFKQWFFDDPSAFIMVTRLIMVTVGLINVALLYRLGVLLGSRRRGLWAAAMLAVTPVSVIFCHYQKSEPMLVLTTLLAMAAIIRWWQRDSAGRAAAAGAAIGLACAVKYNAALLIAPAVATCIRYALGELRGQWRRLALNRVGLGVLCLVVVFFVLNPYLLLDAGEAIRQLAGQKRLMQAGHGGLGESPARSYLTVIMPVGFGWPLYLLFLVGLVWLTVEAIRRRSVETVLLVLVAFYAVAMMTQKLVAVYYPLPMVPALALGAAGLISRATGRTRLAGWAAAGILLAPMGRSLVMDYRLALPSPGFRSEYWIGDNIPPGERVIHRHWLSPQLAEHRRRLGCLPWPLGPTMQPEQVQDAVDRGVRWMVLNAHHTDGREVELFGPAANPLARPVRRFEIPRTLLPTNAGAIVIWKVVQPAEVPPLARVHADPSAVRPRQRIDAVFENGVTLLGLDPMGDAPMQPGDIVEFPTYWHVPAGKSARMLVTGDLRGKGGFLADLTHELAYGIDAFVERPDDRACVVTDRILVRAPHRTKPGAYDVVVGLRVSDGAKGLAIIGGPGASTKRCKVGRITVAE